MNLKTILNIGLAVLILVMISGSDLLSADLKLIEDPKPTHVEKNFKDLVVVKEISADFNDEYFLADPTSLTVDDEYNLFVFDRKFQKIFKFSKEFKYVKTFGRGGRGPGEYENSPLANKMLYYAQNGMLYFSDARNKKIIAYDKNGSFLKEISIPKYYPKLHPVFKKNGDYFLPSDEGVLDVYDKNSVKTHVLLDTAVYQTFLLRLPAPDQVINGRSTLTETYYDVLNDDRLIIYLSNSSTVYIFKDYKLEKSIALWTKDSLSNAKDGIAYLKKIRKDDNWGISIFDFFFVDKDSEGFYLFSNGIYPYQSNLYKFMLDGQLKCVYRIDRRKFGVIKVFTKKNNLFYGISRDGEIKILMEKINK